VLALSMKERFRISGLGTAAGAARWQSIRSRRYAANRRRVNGSQPVHLPRSNRQQTGETMTNVGENILAIVMAVIGSALFQAGLNRIWPSEKRRPYNELIGSQITVLGTTYAVILGFMLYTVWTALGEANLNVDLEANAVEEMHHLVKGLPEPQRTQLQTLARSYTDAAVTQDWPQMARGEAPEKTGSINEEMWDTVMSVQLASPTEINVQHHVLAQLGSLDQHRMTRILQSATSLPTVLWCVLLAGGALTIISACMFGAENMKLQTLQVIFLSLLVSLSLVAIADIHRPFHGLIRVRSEAFLRARRTMQAH
jgi:hypothetical protein